MSFKCWDLLAFGNHHLYQLWWLNIKGEICSKLERVVHRMSVKRAGFSKGKWFFHHSLSENYLSIFCRPLRKQDFADHCMLLLAGNGIRFPIAINYYIPVCNNYCVLCTTFAFQIKFCSTETSHIQKPLRSVEITLLPLAFFFPPWKKRRGR